MNSDLYTLITSIAGILILGLSTILWWFVRERMKTRDRKEDLLERRLASGTQTMQSIMAKIETIHDMQVQQSNTFVRKDEFKDYCKDHNRIHDNLDKSMEMIRQGQNEMKEAITKIGVRVEAGVSTLSSMLSKLVVIPKEADNT